MVNFDPNLRWGAQAPAAFGGPGALPHVASPTAPASGTGTAKPDFLSAIEAAGKYVSKVDDLQQASDASIQDLLTGKNNDITAVVSAVAKADVSFKVLVGVRNKLIEAYKQTMNMPL
ncbi:MAG: flagellar hook-basal body complex protein FliE [Planctomycetes bacterium]|nr:flagellar hook-basal body complex protein FliE [Planctomycetota bacterium]